MQRWNEFARDESGTTSIEYSVMIALIMAVLLAAVATFGMGQNGKWIGIRGDMRNHGM